MASLFRPRPEVGIDALRGVGRLLGRLASKLGGTVGSTATAVDPTCDRLSGLDHVPPLIHGVVTRAGIGSYDCEVVIQGGQTVVCSSLSPVASDVYGPSQACIPTPGSTVLVYVTAAGIGRNPVSRGVILGVVPTAGGASTDGASSTKLADTEFAEGGVAQFTESGPMAIASDTDYPYTGEHQCGRPHDMVPGEYGVLNHAGAGLVIGAVSSAIKGSEFASVRCSGLDDQVRIVSGHYRHINAAGSDEVYNDGGYISVESAVSMYQPERLGVKANNTPAFDWSPDSSLALKETSSGITPLRPNQTAKKRLYRYSGYLGDVVNVFVANPDPSKEVEDMDTDSLDQGLYHKHVDSSGRLTVRSASGILLERYDRIPVPKRKHYPWDPKGDKEGSDPDKKEGFKHPAKYPMGIGATLADRAAWDDYLAYERFRQFGKDFYIPDQKDLKCPADDYDMLGKGSENFQEYDKRHSYIGLTPDGGIVLRDAWGSEIVMADGRITLNAAANIEIRSGASVVVMGGDDLIAKAYNSIDLSATKKDVRIKAENNMQCVSMRRGILLQSKADSDGNPEWDKPGEELESAGVVIKADKASVNIVGAKTSIQGSNRVAVSSFDEYGKPSGSIIVAGKQVSSVAEDNVILTAGGGSGVIVSEQSAVVCAPSVLAVGGQSAADVSGNQMMLGIPVDVGSMYSELISVCKDQSQRYLDSVEWLNPLPPTVVSEVDFKYRTSEQYGTDVDSGVSGGVFSVYQASWAVMADAGRVPMAGVQTRQWDETPDSYDQYPWPGKAAMQGQSYVTYKDVNVKNDGSEEPGSSAAELTPTGFLSYHIRVTK